MYRIQSGRPQHSWVSVLYSIASLVAVGLILWFLLPFILAFIIVLVLAGLVGYFWLRWKLKKMSRQQSSSFSQEGEEYVDFEIVDEK
jgi:Flp pilus assembly protein TadB